MAVKLICLTLLLVLLCPIGAREPCRRSASTCNECIQSGPACAWCTAPQFNIRCHTLKGLLRAGCHKGDIYNPRGDVQVAKNDSSTEQAKAQTPFLQPQELSLRLRPGVSQSFPLIITMPTDQPITELTMDTSPVPAGLNITFDSIMNGNPLVVQVDVEAAQCPSESDDSSQMQNRTGPWSVQITPRGFSMSVKLEITLECQCHRTRNREENSPSCSGHGALVCGQCECSEPYFGLQCQLHDGSVSPPNDYGCRSGPHAPVCSGRGECIMNQCQCQNRENSKDRYSGRFCECSNFDCLYYNNRICGGHGRCMCGQCICDDSWTDEDCSCSMETASCMASNQMVCNGRGTCQCGICKCEPPYAGPTCEDCPSCVGICQQHVACVECRAFGTGPKKDRCDQECGHLTVMMVETKQDLTQPDQATRLCKKMSSEDYCFFHYTITNTPSGGQSTVAQAKECAFN